MISIVRIPEVGSAGLVPTAASAATPATTNTNCLRPIPGCAVALWCQTHRAAASPSGMTSESVGSGVVPASLPDIRARDVDIRLWTESKVLKQA